MPLPKPPTDPVFLLDSPACVRDQIDIALGVQAIICSCFEHAGQPVALAMETDEGGERLLYAEAPRARRVLWADADERGIETRWAIQLQVFTTTKGLAIDARLGDRSEAFFRYMAEPGSLPVPDMIDAMVGQVLEACGLPAQSVSARKAFGVEAPEAFALKLAELGHSIRRDFGFTSIEHRDVANRPPGLMN